MNVDLIHFVTCKVIATLPSEETARHYMKENNLLETINMWGARFIVPSCLQRENHTQIVVLSKGGVTE
jgi:hypothetical protein